MFKDRAGVYGAGQQQDSGVRDKTGCGGNERRIGTCMNTTKL